MAGTARSRLAFSSTMMALLPPNSSRHLPSRSATRTPICRPTGRAGKRDQSHAPVVDETAGEFGARVDES